MLEVGPSNEPLHHLVDQARRLAGSRRRAPGRTPAGPPVAERGLEEGEELRPREKCGAADEVAVGRQQRGAGQPAQVIAAVDIGTGIGVHAHGERRALHRRGHARVVPGLLVHPMASMAPARREREQHGLAESPGTRKRLIPPRAPLDRHGVRL